MSTAPRKSLEPYLFDAVDFYPHQVEGIRDLAKRRNFILADDMGLGKSLEALTTFVIDIKRGWATKALVICPATLRSNWADEIEKFTRLPYTLLGEVPHPNKPGYTKTLTKDDRSVQLHKFAVENTPRILVANYEQISPHLSELNALDFDVVIYDEAHYMKNRKAQRTKAAMAVQASRRFMLTGSPMLNHVNDLWTLLNLVDPNTYNSYWRFVNRYCVFGGWKDKQIVGVKNEKELTERLQGVMVRRLKKDVLNLPDVQFIQRKVDLSAAQRKLYEEAVNDLRITLPNGDPAMEIENELVKFTRLKQICATPFGITGVDESNKLDLVVEDLIQLMDGGYKVVLFTQFRPVLVCLQNRLAKEGYNDLFQLHGDIPKSERPKVVSDWSKAKEPIPLAAMLQVGGQGLNMTASRHMLRVDKLFTPMMNQQAVDRLNRIGADETQPIQVIDYLTRNTIENRIEQINKTKIKLNNDIVEQSDFQRKLLAQLKQELLQGAA